MGFLDLLFGSSKRKEEIIGAIGRGAVIIDVRTKGEYAYGKVIGSVNIPLNDLSGSLKKLKKLDKPIVMCCASGSRSASAVSYLKGQGVQDVHNGGSWLKVRKLMAMAEQEV